MFDFDCANIGLVVVFCSVAAKTFFERLKN